LGTALGTANGTRFSDPFWNLGDGWSGSGSTGFYYNTEINYN